MLPPEAKVVETPTFFPYACAWCSGQKGKMIDTGVERPTAGGIFREYLCSSCLKGAAQLRGFAKGEEMERLERAAEALDEAEKVLDGLHERIKVMDARITSQAQAIEAKDAELEQLRGRDEQRRFLAEQLRTQANELAGVA
jgi:hypothetical protein